MRSFLGLLKLNLPCRRTLLLGCRLQVASVNGAVVISRLFDIVLLVLLFVGG